MSWKSQDGIEIPGWIGPGSSCWMFAHDATGQAYRITFYAAELAAMVRRARDSKSGRCRDGAVLVERRSDP